MFFTSIASTLHLLQFVKKQVFKHVHIPKNGKIAMVTHKSNTVVFALCNIVSKCYQRCYCQTVSTLLTYLLYPFGKLLESIRPLGEPSVSQEPFHSQLVEEDEARDGAELRRLCEVGLWDGSTDCHSPKCVHVWQHRLKPFTTHLRKEEWTSIKMEHNVHGNCESNVYV